MQPATDARGVQLHPPRMSIQPFRSINRKRYKIAVMLHQALTSRIRSLLDPTDTADEIVQLIRKFPDIEMGVRENLPKNEYYALMRIIENACLRIRSVRDFVERLDDFRNRLTSVDMGRLPTADLPIPTVKSLIGDVEAMERSFSGLLLGPKMLAVVTDDIELSAENGDSFNFGKFKIVLDLQSYATSVTGTNYRIHACTPRHPNNGSSMEHPHVSEHVLCEGNAGVHVERALNEGRFFDFFHIINNTLQVYNSSSPHLRLRYWTHDAPEYECTNCGDEMSDDDQTSCGCCDQLFCSDCSTYCDRGAQALCISCRDNADSACPGCDDYGAAGCLLHENEPCEICGSIASDDETISCDADFTFCQRCLDRLTECPEVCEDCRYMAGCHYLPDRFKENDEQEEEEEAESLHADADSSSS